MAEREYRARRIFDEKGAYSKERPYNPSEENHISMGGIALYLLLLIARVAGDGTFAVATMPRARNKKELKKAIALARSEWVNYGYRDDDKYVFVHIGGTKGWLTPLNSMGFSAWAIGKVVKRLKTFNRPSILGGEIKRDLNILVVDNPMAYANNETLAEADTLTDDQKDMLLDGIMVMKRRFLMEIVRMSGFHRTDPLRAQLQKSRVLRSWIFNIRLLSRLGFAKGNVVVGDDDAMGEYDLIIPAVNIKQEITSTRQTIVLDPHPPKDVVVTDIQTMINNPKLHPQVSVGEWIKDHFAKAIKTLREGNVLESFNEVEELRQSAMDKALKNYDDATEGISNRMRWSAIRWKLHGLDIRHSPFILERIAAGFYENLVDVDDEAERAKKPGFRYGTPRVPIPCTIQQQVITESAAVMSGWWKPGMSVERGKIKRIPHIGVHVIHDLDFIEHYDDHGGDDLDDEFKLFYREMVGGEFDGKKVVIVIRSPNSWGEYSIYEYVDGEEFPTWTKANGTVVSFPKVNGRHWPKQLSKALKDHNTKYTGLPGGGVSRFNNASQQYSRKDFVDSIRDSMGSSTVGMYVLADMLYALVMKKHRPERLCSLEDAIDTYTMDGTLDDRKAIDVAARVLIREVVLSGKPIPRIFWEGRPGLARLAPKNVPVNLTDDDFLTRTLTKLNDGIRKFRDEVHEMGQEMRYVPESVILLGGKYYDLATELTEEWRDRVTQENSKHAGPVKVNWQWVFEPIARAFNEKMQVSEFEAYDLALALAAVAHTNSTSTRGYQDTIPCNGRIVGIPGLPDITPFDWYLNAMRYYGIAWNEVFVDNHERPMRHTQRTSWTLSCEEPGCPNQDVVVTDPMKVQEYHTRGNRCKRHGS